MVYPIPSKSRSESGIIVTSLIDKTAPREGIVLAIGPGKRDDDTGAVTPIDYQFGDRVVYVMSNMLEVKNDNEIFHVVPATEILCKLKEE